MSTPLRQGLPAIGSALESETLDFKSRMHTFPDGTIDQLGIALPVAAFANRLGGTLLYGASEGPNATLSGYAPLSEKELGDYQRACDQAVKTRCAPPPLWTSSVVAVDGGHVFAVKVEPYAESVVAVRVTADRTKGYGGEAFVYPMRVGSQTKYLTPEQVPMFMDPKIRRTLIILGKINPGEEVELARPIGNGGMYSRNSYTITRIDPELNAVTLNGSESFRIPLDRIDSVWFDGRKWCVICPH